MRRKGLRLRCSAYISIERRKNTRSEKRERQEKKRRKDLRNHACRHACIA
jgi:hypothetical protein